MFKKDINTNLKGMTQVIKVGDFVKVNDNILTFYEGLKQMHGRVGRVEEINPPYAKIIFAGKTKEYQKNIPTDCLTPITEKEFTRIGVADALNTNWNKPKNNKNREK